MTSDGTYVVQVNGIAVGRIDAHEVETIRSTVRRDVDVAFRQLGNTCLTLLNAIGLAVLMPWSIIGVVFGLMSYLAPAQLAELLAAILANPTQELAVLFRILPMLAVGSFALLPMFPGWRRRLGFRNCYREALAHEIRLRVGCAAEGELDLFTPGVQMFGPKRSI